MNRFNSINNSQLYLAIYFPEWSIDVTRRKLAALTPPLKPPAILLTTNQANQTIVMRGCRSALQSGVRPLMSLSLAQTFVPSGSYHEPFDPSRDLTALRTLAIWCHRFAPYVGIDHELHKAQVNNELIVTSPQHYGIMLDLTGTERLHRDLTLLSKNIHALFKNRARIALAPTIGGAWALSRFAARSPAITKTISELKEDAKNLPIEALRIDSLTSAKLSDLGIYTIGELMNLPRHSLAGRFGKRLVLRLSQLLGATEERSYLITPQERYIQTKIFETPLSHRGAITIVIERMFIALIATLKEANIVAKLFILEIRDVADGRFYRELALAAASNDTKHLNAIIHPIIEALSFCGEIRQISLEATDLSFAALAQRSFSQPDSFEATAITRAYQELLNAFALKMGKERILHARLNNSYIPERSFIYDSPLDSSALKDRQSGEAIHYSPPIYGSRERPTFLFVVPEPIQTISLLPDTPPSWIKWRKTDLTIISGIGPERIAPEWWRKEAPQLELSERDYFTVQDSTGRWLWIFRNQADYSWFIHGVWT